MAEQESTLSGAQRVRRVVAARYPTSTDKTYLGAALLLATWSIVFILGAFAGDDVSNWWAFLSLAGVAMLAGLRVERQQRALGQLLVVLPGIAVSVLTFWLGIPIAVALVLVVTWIMRMRANPRP